MHFIVLSRMLVHEAEELGNADDARWDSARAEHCVRKHYRDPAADELRRMIVDLRQCLTGMYGTRKANDLLGIPGRTPRSRAELPHFGRLLVLGLTELELPAPRVDIGVSPRTWARKMKPLAPCQLHMRERHRHRARRGAPWEHHMSHGVAAPARGEPRPRHGDRPPPRTER